jgi:hypothetical protein
LLLLLYLSFPYVLAFRAPCKIVQFTFSLHDHFFLFISMYFISRNASRLLLTDRVLAETVLRPPPVPLVPVLLLPFGHWADHCSRSYAAPPPALFHSWFAGQTLAAWPHQCRTRRTRCRPAESPARTTEACLWQNTQKKAQNKHNTKGGDGNFIGRRKRGKGFRWGNKEQR